MGTGQETHRAGAFKQTNKAHKTGRHRSKGSISSAVKGKVGVKSLTKRLRKELGKEARRHQSQQLRAKKREEVLVAKRNLGGSLAAPILITIIPLQEDLDVKRVVNNLTGADENAEVAESPQGLTHISIPRFKQRFSLIVPPVGNTFATLDAAKVSTTLLFVTSVALESCGNQKSEAIDSWGEEILEACLAQGLPTTIIAITDLESIPIKKRQDVKQTTQEVFSKWFPEEKIHPLDKPVDALNLLRKAGAQKQRAVAYRNRRPHLIAEKLKFTSSGENTGTLEISGYLRGQPLSVNSLIHIPDFGDFQMTQIDASDDPYPLDKSRKHEDELKMAETRVLEVADPATQESLQSENIPDPMDAEQTWPTEEELAQAQDQKKRKIVKRVPKGTSEYQAAWIPDEDGEPDSNPDSTPSDEEMSIADPQSEDEEDDDQHPNDDDFETMTVSEAPPDHQKYDEEMDFYEEKTSMQKLKESKTDAQFPDEVDTPQDTPARIRFQKYRGLESFRTSPWDPQENLPFDYSRIFQFENFERTRRRILKESYDSDGTRPGWFITLHVKNVPRSIFEAFCALNDRPLIVFGLLPNENKMSLLNVVLKSKIDSSEPIKSKERLIFQCGFRRFSACPIFSQHTNGSKHKFVRYLQPEDTVVASMFAPIIFPPCPVICYKEMKNGSLEVVGRGSVLSADPNRLVIKRAVLSGHPFKVHKRSAVVRFMFFEREDINWFKPIGLRTKYGRRGHIKEPLGTHGHMKCVFDGQLKSQDTILMNLYKRVFPKWTYEPCLITSGASNEENMME
ncbi:pre-rRNA-processing protein TSR1 homolog [Fopius arisanus]|uniref:Pre-rRNA-processing protein TSR1 homolog n=1 Tax=Fopius arisanus TaxID=64838 RepID=A0A9R1U3M5_9HYME|nr:PREDICTED: pre-rRNA-processing protein TSR1 homolog [Fopius arisanus]